MSRHTCQIPRCGGYAAVIRASNTHGTAELCYTHDGWSWSEILAAMTAPAADGCTCPHPAADHGDAGCEHTSRGPSVMVGCPCNGTEPPHRYACKSCGGESPVGIGYAVTAADRLPDADPSCVGPHLTVVGAR